MSVPLFKQYELQFPFASNLDQEQLRLALLILLPCAQVPNS